MSELRKAAEAAIEALEGVLDTYGEPLDLLSISGGAYEALQCRDAITALKAALAATREHITDGSPCWCNPELNYVDPDTGAKVWVHKEAQ